MRRDDRMCERFNCKKRVWPASAFAMRSGEMVCGKPCMTIHCGYSGCNSCKARKAVPNDCPFRLEYIVSEKA